ncbi:MAG: hypothetical protein ACRBN8_11080 [Nannocystales bacterium]
MSFETIPVRGFASLFLLPLLGCVADVAVDEGSTTSETSSTSATSVGESGSEVPSSSAASSSGTSDDPSTSGSEPTCSDGLHNGGETDVDCGQECGGTCEVGQGCVDATDCVSGSCDATTLVCVEPFACPNDDTWDSFLGQERHRANPDDETNVPPVVVMAADGRYAVAWTEISKEFTVLMQQYDPSGRPSAPVVRLSDVSHSLTDAPALATNASGELVVGYLMASGDAFGPFVRKFAADGREVLGPTLASPPEHFLGSLTPDVAIADDGTFVVAWTPMQSAPQAVWMQLYAPDGTPSAEPIQVSPAAQLVLARPNVDMGSDGTVLAAWVVEDEGTCFARRFDASGQPLEDAWRVTPEDESTTVPCGVSVGPNGQFALTWVRVAPPRDGVVRDGVLRSYASTGDILGTVDVDPGQPVHDPYPQEWHPPPVSVDINGDGNIVVGYTVDKAHTGWVRTFDATGEPLIDPVVVAAQHVLLTTPVVAAAACSDSFVVAWLRGNGGPVFSRLFGADDDENDVADLCCE